MSDPFKSATLRRMTREQFLEKLQAQAATFGKAVATNEGEWIIKGFIDVYRRIYTISVDTKIVSKVLELLLFPMFVKFAKTHGLKIGASVCLRHGPADNFERRPVTQLGVGFGNLVGGHFLSNEATK